MFTDEYLSSERSQEWRETIRKSMKASDRTGKERIHMPEQEANVRNKNMKEVNKGLTEEQALTEAKRCLDCAQPTCINGCPVGINIPKFIKKIETGDLDVYKRQIYIFGPGKINRIS